ncbi:ROK family transcriptional regulator [Affinibrenneria salicis]|uniref:ROK family transcriptional regulator n=1 Tax=Affinibrenneria salicis TaxID=2590031 RepID=A0A5J5FVG2_9GAMM|nr:ROK family transcriptional regulator [Affinibrenneria salicis]KAA8997397.1 ROK family transcriptional regulator [Affinibrenneria salicis]
MTAPNITARILRLIVEHSPVSQSDLKVRSGLSMSTVSQATNRLLSQGVIHELGLRRVSMGRPKTLLGLRPDYATVVGIQLNAERNLIVMTDLAGNLLGEQQIPSGELTPRQLGDALAKFLRTVEDKRVGAIGLALSGLVDPANGSCIRSKVLDWDNVPIAQMLEARFSLPVFIENDANAMAMAALVFGQLGNARSAIIATYGKGIGAGIIIDRQLYRGRHGKAGEIGNALLGDGSRRLLEEVASSRAILQKIAGASGEEAPANLLQLDQRPDAGVLETLAEAGHHLGMSLANLSVAFDPDVVYLAMEPQMASRIFLDQVSQSFQTYRLSLTPQKTPLQFLTESNRMWALGAAGFAVNKLLDILSAEADEE